jgi:FlaA1/EpsC-like NDP-sugar epimerase
MRDGLVKSAICVLAWICALGLALIWSGAPATHFLVLAAISIIVKVGATGLFGSFHELWSHTSLEDLVVLVAGALVSTLVIGTLLLLAPWLAPPQVALVDGVLSLAFVSSARVAPRIYQEMLRPLGAARSRAVVIAGRAELVDLELRRLRRQAPSKERVAGLVLDGPPLDGARLHRLRVLGRGELESLIERRCINEVTVVPPISPLFSNSLRKLCSAHRVPFRPAASLLALTELLRSAEQLLDRAPTEPLADPALREKIADRCVLVTGAGGSIGSELALQLIRFHPRKLILVNRGENALFHAERALAAVNESKCEVVGCVLDVRSEESLQRLFARHRPELVFHAAAHKHVPLMERHPAEAVLNNVGGIRVISQAAHGHGADGLVFISTDKAVRPTSIMGATKRLGELYVGAMAAHSKTRFVSVRFGNVLGSNGSVLPIFIDQVQRGGPVTVTHEDMTRYFMSIPEACTLVLGAAIHGEGGELFVLDMGRPTRILALAERVIERAGLRPHEDVPITFSGARPGEKLTEELMSESERAGASFDRGMWRVDVDVDETPLDRLNAQLDALLDVARSGDDVAVREMLARILPDFQSGEADRDDDDDAEFPTEAPALAAM